MGRIADALARAERRRGQDSPVERLPVSGAMNRWADWYGTAQDAGGGSQQQTDSTPRLPDPPVEGMSEEIVTYYTPSCMVGEQYRALRTRLLSANPYHEHRIYAISSAVPKEGKSVTAANLAFSLAEVSHLKVLIVDADLRHSSLAKLLNIDREPGLGDYLLDRVDYEEVIRPTPVPNLHFMAAGRTHGRPVAGLFSTRKARTAFARFQKEFHYTIVDTPPATTVADVGILAQMTSGVLMVIRMHRTPEPLAKRAVKHLINNNIPIIGSIVIGDNDPAGGYGYQYGYYRYYRDEGS